MLDREALNRRANAAATECGLSQKQLTQLQSCAHAVYEEIGGDLEPDNARSRTCKRSTILEVVTDAGRLREVVKQRTKDKALADVCSEYRLIDDLIGPAFLYEDYEVGNSW